MLYKLKIKILYYMIMWGQMDLEAQNNSLMLMKDIRLLNLTFGKNFNNKVSWNNNYNIYLK